MRFLIDGHNLIHAMTSISIEDPDDEAKLVSALRSHMIGQNDKCTVIFDGGLPGGHSHLSCSRVQVIFANTGQEADQRLIKHILKENNPTSCVLVSSDSRIKTVAQRRKMKVLLAQDFSKMMETPSQARLSTRGYRA